MNVLANTFLLDRKINILLRSQLPATLGILIALQGKARH